MNAKLKSAAIYGGILLGGPCVIYTAASLLGWQRGATFKAGAQTLDAEAIKNYVALGLPLIVAFIKAWFGKLSADKQESIKRDAALAFEIVSQLRGALVGKGPQPEIVESVIEKQVNELRFGLNELKEEFKEMKAKVPA